MAAAKAWPAPSGSTTRDAVAEPITRPRAPAARAGDPPQRPRARLRRPAARGRRAADAGAGDQRRAHRRAARAPARRWCSARTSAVKGGVYGVTRGLRKRFGAAPGLRHPARRADRSSARRSARRWPASLPIPEIQYLAYLHNAEDQLRGEAASLRFFSDGQYQNGMVVRVAGLAYQKGFGGHFHNDNSVAVLRDIPGLVLAVAEPSARGARRCCATCLGAGRARAGSASSSSRSRSTTSATCTDGDGGWTATYAAAGRVARRVRDRARPRAHVRRGPRPPARDVRQRRAR